MVLTRLTQRLQVTYSAHFALGSRPFSTNTGGLRCRVACSYANAQLSKSPSFHKRADSSKPNGQRYVSLANEPAKLHTAIQDNSEIRIRVARFGTFKPGVRVERRKSPLRSPFTGTVRSISPDGRRVTVYRDDLHVTQTVAASVLYRL